MTGMMTLMYVHDDIKNKCIKRPMMTSHNFLSIWQICHANILFECQQWHHTIKICFSWQLCHSKFQQYITLPMQSPYADIYLKTMGMNILTSELKLIRKAMTWNLNEILDKLLNNIRALKRSMNNNQLKETPISP